MPEESSRRSVQQLENSVDRAQFWCECYNVLQTRRSATAAMYHGTCEMCRMILVDQLTQLRF